MKANQPTDSEVPIEPPFITHYSTLVRLIYGLVDSDAILPEDGSELLRSLELAGRLLSNGQFETARRQLKYVALLAEELVRSDTLDDQMACVVIDAVRRIELGE